MEIFVFIKTFFSVFGLKVVSLWPGTCVGPSGEGLRGEREGEPLWLQGLSFEPGGMNWRSRGVGAGWCSSGWCPRSAEGLGTDFEMTGVSRTWAA